MPWIPSAVHNRQDNDLVVDRAEVHTVRKPSDERPPCVALHAGIGQRIPENRRDRCFDRRGKDGTQTETLSLIPGSRIE
jgi:hypothetical protein